MTHSPFFSLKIRTRKDALLARQKARRVAHLLQFDPQEQACIAAGVFVIACQARTLLGQALLCFQCEGQQLHVFAQELPEATLETASGAANRISALLGDRDRKKLFRLIKPLPALHRAQAEELDLGWLVNQVTEMAGEGLFDEIMKQNQEILALLHALRLCQGSPTQKEEKLPTPHAA